MAFDNKKNFAKGTLNGAINDTQTTLNLNPGDGAKFPDPPFNVVIWNKGVYEDPADDPNVEIVRVTDKGSGDDWTIIRAQEGTNVHSHPDGSRVDLVPTVKTFTDIEQYLNQGVKTTDSPTFAGLTVDSDTLYVDSNNHKVGIGTTNPYEKLCVVGNVVIGNANVGTDGTRVLMLTNGVVPTSSPPDAVQLYAEDVGGSSELKVRDEAGNITTLSPHNFTLFKPKKSYFFPWSFYSRNDYLGVEINVDMYGAIKEIERLSGKKFIYTRKFKPKGQKPKNE